jgi:hypothetical protein
MNHSLPSEKNANYILLDIFIFIISMWLSLTLINDLITVFGTFIDENYFTHLSADNFLPIKLIAFYIPFFFTYLFCLTKCYRYLTNKKRIKALLFLVSPLILILVFHITMM